MALPPPNKARKLYLDVLLDRLLVIKQDNERNYPLFLHKRMNYFTVIMCCVVAGIHSSAGEQLSLGGFLFRIKIVIQVDRQEAEYRDPSILKGRLNTWYLVKQSATVLLLSALAYI